MPVRVPLFNLSRAEERIAADLNERWSRLRAATAFVGGAEVAEFESSWAQFLDPSEQTGCVAVANGTDAIELALRAFQVHPGDEVLVPAYTFVATASAVALAGGTPVMVDVDAATLNLDFDLAEELVTERTVGVIGVHLYGQPCDLHRAAEFTAKHGLWLLEDAAQAHGARWRGQRVGTLGHLATWSFYPSKNLGCFGDGGAITGTDPELVATVRRLADHGRIEHYWHGLVGRNSRLDGLQAAVLNARLPLLDDDNQRRREVAAIYRSTIDSLAGIEALAVDERAEPVFHQFTVRVTGENGDRDRVKEQLAEAGIGTAIHYPAPLHTQPLWKDRSDVVRGSYPVAERAAAEVLCLPMFPEIENHEVEAVVEVVESILSD